MSDEKVFNKDEKAKLTYLINEGVRVMDEIEILNGGLSDTVKAIAEEMDIKPGVLKKAIRTAFKMNFQEATTDYELLENILESVGRTD
jgi:transposase-like protein